MQALRVLVVVMGVMIVAGVVGLGVLLAQKLGGGGTAASAWALPLGEPAGSAIVAVVPVGEMVALHLRGGGGERVVMVEARGGRVAGRIRIGE